MKNRKLLWVLLLSPAFLLLGYLNWLTNWERVTDPVMVRNITEREQYRPDGWSDEIITQDETAIWYKDRVREHFPMEGNQERIEYILQGWNGLFAYIPESVDSYIVPIPVPILYEKEGTEDYKHYQAFIESLAKETGNKGEVVDLYESLSEHKEEYIYYGEERALTNLGGYYATDGLLAAMGEKGLPELVKYREELYYGKDAVSELTYLYSLPESKGYCEVFNVDDSGQVQSVKKPVLRNGGAGSGSIIAEGSHNWAVVEGDGGKEEGTVLLIGDRSAIVMAPFLANHFQQVYYVFLSWDDEFGSEYHPIDKIFEEYDIRKVVLAQWASDIGGKGKMSAFGELRKKMEE